MSVVGDVADWIAEATGFGGGAPFVQGADTSYGGYYDARYAKEQDRNANQAYLDELEAAQRQERIADAYRSAAKGQGGSVAERALLSEAQQARAQQTALARSARGPGMAEAQRGALAQQAQIRQGTARDVTTLRAQEAEQARLGYGAALEQQRAQNIQAEQAGMQQSFAARGGQLNAQAGLATALSNEEIAYEQQAGQKRAATVGTLATLGSAGVIRSDAESKRELSAADIDRKIADLDAERVRREAARRGHARSRAAQMAELDQVEAEASRGLRPSVGRFEDTPPAERAAVGAMATDAMRATRPVAFEYEPEIVDPWASRSGPARPGPHVGVTAQQLEQTPAGRTVVEQGPEGKSVDVGGLAALNTAALGEQARQVDSQESRLQELEDRIFGGTASRWLETRRRQRGMGRAAPMAREAPAAAAPASEIVDPWAARGAATPGSARIHELLAEHGTQVPSRFATGYR